MRTLAAAMVVGLAACGDSAATVGGDDNEGVVDAPLLGADGKDAADRACNVALRSMARLPKGPGFETNCVNGRCVMVWAGVLDVSKQAELEGAVPSVLFKNLDATTWSEVVTTRVGEGARGYSRYAFRLERDTISDGMSAGALSRARIDVAPFIKLRNGARLFDKQRGLGDFDNYVLNQAGGWSITDAPSVCPARPAANASLDFDGAWRTTQRGALVAGATATVTYALDRLTTCRGTHNGHPAWDMRAFVRFSPSGNVVDGSLRAVNNSGVGGLSVAPVPFTFEIPFGTTSVELWFKNSTGAGSSCEAYDSAFGENYRFNVEPGALAPVAWAGNVGSSFSRLCERQNGAPDEAKLDSYVQQRACAFVDVDVYVPGLTDGAVVKPYAVLAQAALKLDGVALEPKWLTFVGRFGNDYRYRFEVPKSDLFYGPKWARFEYTPRFSTDGATWRSEQSRFVVRDASFCNTAWASCTVP